MLVKVIIHLKVGAQKKTRIKDRISSIDYESVSYLVLDRKCQHLLVKGPAGCAMNVFIASGRGNFMAAA